MAYNKLRLNTDTPFLKGEFPNPLKGAHLDWITRVSDAMTGSCGGGNILDTNGNNVGLFKAFGGFVFCTFHVTQSGTIVMPCNPFNRAPVFFSDGQIIWGSKISNDWTVDVTTTTAIDGYCTFWS